MPYRIDGRWYVRKHVLGLFQALRNLRDKIGNFVRWIERTESRNAIGIIEIPLILRDPDEVTNCRIGCPGAAQCCPGQFGRDAGVEESRDIRVSGNRFDRWQASEIEGTLGRDISGRWLCGLRDLGLFSLSTFRRPLETRPAEEDVILRHCSVSCPVRRLLAIAFPFDEGAFDMVFGNEAADDLGDANRHRHGFNQIAARVGEGLALRRVGGDSE